MALARAIAAWLADRLGTVGDRSFSFGRRSERLAERHLGRRGYKMLERNFRAAGAEVDLVAIDGDTLVFVEVKARRTDRAGTAQAAVDERKQRRIHRAAKVYLARHPEHRGPVRFDVVAIHGDGMAQRLEILRDAF